MKYKFFYTAPGTEQILGQGFRGGGGDGGGKPGGGRRKIPPRLHKNRRNTRKGRENRRKIVQICEAAGRREFKNNTN